MSNSTSKPRWAMQLGGTIIAVLGLLATLTAVASASTSNLQQGTNLVITPEFCLNLSLGGAATYPLDVDGDGVHDICSLRGTRRATAARQNTLERLGDAFPQYFSRLYASECLKVNESYSAAERAKELEDECAAPRQAQAQGRAIPPVPRPRQLEANTDPRFFSGPVVNSPSFCLNFSFGGPVTYPLDVDGDGVADICSLPTTRRATIARQNAYERLASEQIELFDLLFVEECLRVPASFATTAREALAEQEDACARALRGETVTGGRGGEDDDDEDDGEDDGEDDDEDDTTGGGGTIGPIALPVASDPPASHVAAPRNIGLVSGDEQITVTWQQPLAEHLTVFRYQVEWSTSPSSWPANQRLVVPRTGATSPCSGTPSGGYTCTISNLVNDRTYYVRIQAVRGTNNQYSPHGNARTTHSITPGLAGPPIWDSTTPLASTEYGTITASWAPPSGSTYVPAYYLVQWSTSPSGWSTSRQLQFSTSHTCAGGGSDFDCDISGLDNNRTYYVRIIGVTTATGPGTWSTTESLRLASTLPVPGVPTNVELETVAGTITGKLGLKADWTAPTGTTNISNYLVQWRSCGATGAPCQPWSANPGANAGQQRVPRTGTTLPDPLTDTVPNLDPLAVYEVRVRAVNEQVASGWSSSARITLGQSQPPTITSWNPVGVSNVTVDWTEPDIVPAPSYYVIQWSSSSSFPTNCSTSPTCGSTSANAGTTSTSIAGLGGADLVINRAYYLRIRTVNTNSEPSAWSPTISFVPGTIVPTTDLNAAQDDVSVNSSGNPRNLILTWSSTTPTDRPVHSGFSVRWRPTHPTNPGNWNSRTLTLAQAGHGDSDCTNYCYTLTGLIGGTEYEVQVQARNAYGSGPWSTTTDASTAIPGEGFAPSQPATQESSVNPRALSVTWTRASWGLTSDGNPEPVTGFVVQSRVENAANWGASRSVSLAQAGCTTPTTGCGSYTYLLTGLTAGTSYEVRVRASNRYGQGAWSTASAVDIPGETFKPSTPTVGDTNEDPRALDITWTNAGIVPTGFTVQYRVAVTGTTTPNSWISRNATLAQAGCTDATNGCSSYTFRLTGLTAGTPYEVRVQARNANGSGPWSDASASAATPGSQLTPTGLSNTPTFTGVSTQTVTWSAVSPGTGLTLSSYTVQWRQCGADGTTCENWTSSRQGNVGFDQQSSSVPAEFEITRLLDYYVYEWRVRANFNKGSSPWGLSNP